MMPGDASLPDSCTSDRCGFVFRSSGRLTRPEVLSDKDTLPFTSLDIYRESILFSDKNSSLLPVTVYRRKLFTVYKTFIDSVMLNHFSTIAPGEYSRIYRDSLWNTIKYCTLFLSVLYFQPCIDHR